MLPFEDRYTRQRQVREVGLDGQQRLMARTLEVRNDADVEALYAERAGFSVRRIPSTAEPDASFTHAEHFQHAEPRSFAQAVQRVLNVIRTELGLGNEGQGQHAQTEQRGQKP